MFPRIDKGPIEYYLSIAPAYNTERREECVRFTFETNEEFHHFQYEITLDYEVGDDRMDFVIKGLKPRGMTMPGVGRAVSHIDLFDVKGNFDVTVTKPGNIINTFQIAIRKLTPKLVKDVAAKGAFLHVSTDEVVGEV